MRPREDQEEGFPLQTSLKFVRSVLYELTRHATHSQRLTELVWIHCMKNVKCINCDLNEIP